MYSFTTQSESITCTYDTWAIEKLKNSQEGLYFLLCSDFLRLSLKSREMSSFPSSFCDPQLQYY